MHKWLQTQQRSQWNDRAKEIKRVQNKEEFYRFLHQDKLPKGCYLSFFICSLEVIQFLEPFFVCLSLLAKTDHCPYYSKARLTLTLW